jgi:hypothetical protein
MQKKIRALLFASALVLSGATAFARPIAGDSDDDTPIVPTNHVPDAGSSVLLISSALTGLAGLRFFVRKKD